jgi:hypothetical protein
MSGVGALWEGADSARIASLKARIATHDRAVAEQFHPLLSQPDIKEYVARWDVFKPLPLLEGNLVFHWDGEIEASELKFNNFLKEFNDVIENRRAVAQGKADELAVKHALEGVANAEEQKRADELAAKQAAGKPYDAKTDDFESKATYVPVPPPAPPLFGLSLPPWAKPAAVGLGALVALKLLFDVVGPRR